MVEEAKREPTVQEIVVALRETTFRGKGRGISVAGRRAADDFKRTAIPHPLRQDDDEKPGAIEYKEAAFTDIADLRDGEMQRLLGENTRLNERIVALLKIIEREQTARNEQRDAERSSTRQTQERDAIVREVKGALEAELRPVLLTVLQLLEQPPLYGSVQRVQTRETSFHSAPPPERREAPGIAPHPARHDPPRQDVARHDAVRHEDGRDGRRLERAPAPHDTERGGYYSGWVPDLIRAAGGDPNAPRPVEGSPEGSHEPRHRERGFIVRIFERITIRHRPVGPHDGRRR